VLITHMKKKQLQKPTDDGDVYYGRELDDVGICVIDLACRT